MQVIGIAGTAKNTGKTTTLTAMLAEAERKGVSLALTSIGYDGELRDNITGLPKPRITVQTGNLVAVAERCLFAGTARVEVLERTAISTPLGPVIIGRVTSPGLLVIAGPNKAAELREVIDRLREYGCDLVLVDGALNRIAPLAETDGLILATGAARSVELDRLAAEARVCARLFGQYRTWPQAQALQGRRQVTLIGKDRGELSLGTGSLLTEDQVRDVAAAWTGETRTMFIPGAVSTAMLERLVLHLGERLNGKTLVFPSGINLLIGGEAAHLLPLLDKIYRQGGKIRLLRRIPLLAITVNPYYPAYRYENNRYSGAWVDPDALQAKVAGQVSVPVFDIKREGGAKLFSLLRRRRRKKPA